MIVRTAAAMLLALAIPGAGHLFLGRRGRAVGFFLVVGAMFAIGLAIGGGLYQLRFEGLPLLRLVAALGSMGSGLLYGVAYWMGVEGQLTSQTYEYGRTFILTAGLMNLLLVLDCFDIASGRRD